MMIVFPANMEMVLCMIASLVVTGIMVPPIVRVCKAKGMVAIPNGRTSHQGAVPTLGGVSIFASILFASSLFMPEDSAGESHYLQPAMVILFFFGMLDDLVGINPYKKLGGQILASLIAIVAANVRMTTLHGLFGVSELPYLVSVLISLFIFLAVINAFNLIDGIDGLASGLGIGISVVFGVWLTMLGRPAFAVLSFALTGSLIVFYGFNVFGKKNKIFMGDTGSMFIGFIFATLGIKIMCCPVSPTIDMSISTIPVVVMSLMIIPIADTLRVIILRILRGQFPFHADRSHCHHDLLRLGFSHRRASTILVIANMVVFFMAISIKTIPVCLLGVLVLSAGIFICSVPRLWLKFVLKRPEEADCHQDLHESFDGI
ncbi:MAG: MraY family glycosyltransferase [Bacteroidales bacterium]|nr:MraY family glycosyltransferase [Bacteroidales bacterium]